MKVLDIDFAILDDPNFKEDSVREEIIAPILRHLGFRADRDPKIVRSKVLTHPYVMFGTSKKRLTLIPDYTLYHCDVPRLVLDAKAPDQNVISGDNVAQVFSYSIHPEIRTCVYALCNGRQFSLFHIFSTDPVRVYELDNMTDLDWEDMRQKVSEIEIQRIEAFDFLLDYGTCFTYLGLDSADMQAFIGLPILLLGKITDNKFHLTAKGHFLHDREVLLSADFTAQQLQQILGEMPPDLRDKCIEGLSRQPFSIDIAEYGFEITFAGHLSPTIEVSTNGEKFRPVIIEDVMPSSPVKLSSLS